MKHPLHPILTYIPHILWNDPTMKNVRGHLGVVPAMTEVIRFVLGIVVIVHLLSSLTVIDINTQYHSCEGLEGLPRWELYKLIFYLHEPVLEVFSPIEGIGTGFRSVFD